MNTSNARPFRRSLFALVLLMLAAPIHAAPKPLPPAAEVAQLATDLTLAFTQAAKANGFQKYFETYAAASFKKSLSADDFAAAFAAMTDPAAALPPIAGLKPIFDPPLSFDKDGALIAQGYFASRPFVRFRYQLVREAGQWKLEGVKIKRSVYSPEHNFARAAPPSAAEAQKLVTASTQAFARAANANDLAPFLREATTPQFQKEVGVDRLTAGFKGMMGGALDLTPLARFTPVIYDPPELDWDKVLTLEGRFPVDPLVLFKYGYAHHGQGWKLVQFTLRYNPD